jgi:hypothetical protein
MPFGCMPSNNAETILKSEFRKRGFPYIGVSYDDTIQPTREEAIAVFAYKAEEYMKKCQNKK